jgi:hypothetical protein
VRGTRLEEVPAARWDALLASIGVRDVYYSQGYVEASAILAGGEPLLLRLAHGEGDVVFAGLVRSDPRDVVAPYGYGGPVTRGSAAAGRAFAAAYDRWCQERGIVSSFVVFHPLLGNAGTEACAGFRRTDLAGTVAWRLGPTDLLAGMHAHHRRVVRRAQRNGLEATIEASPRDLDAFVSLYEATMRRAGAAPFYHFADPYWEGLLRHVPLVRVEVRREGELLGSVLGMGRPPWLHYHLGATADAGRAAGASHLALYALARWGQANGYETLHLGGGVGGREDSLLAFKLRFAPGGRLPAALGKAVHLPADYLRLSGSAAVDWDGFFPAYRRPRQPA